VLFGLRYPTLYRTIIVVVLSVVTSSVAAQELVPRAYWPAPNGTNLLVASYQYSSGDVVTDQTLPVDGVDSKLNFAQVTYQRTFSLFDRSANIQLNLPYSWGVTEGEVEGEFVDRELSTLSDARVLLAVNLLGAPSMDAKEFQALRAKPRPIIGASILIQVPTGGYDPDYIINVGSNRWSTKLAVGGIWPIRPTWLFEAEVGVWLFGENDDFVGTTRTQDSIYSAQLHLVKRIKAGFWASLDLNYYSGGRTTIDNDTRLDGQQNSRFGATLLFPVRAHDAIRVSISTGIVTSAGGDHDTFILAYGHAW
jgi:hypothetical protein